MSDSRVFSKKPLSYQNLIEKLISRGLLVDNQDYAVKQLKTISYYRFSGYGLPFEQVDDSGKRLHHYKPDTHFSTLNSAYIVDRKIRTLIISAIERIEVAVRSAINHEMALHYNDAHWYLSAELFKEAVDFTYKAFINEIKRHTGKNAEPGSDKEQRREIFIHHYYNQYDTPEYPPCWMVAEVLSLGSWSKVYENLKTSSDRKRISRQFDLSPPAMQSWLHSLTYLRNICAHHSRLFGRKFVIRPRAAKGIPLQDDNRLYNYICITYWLLKKISPETTWLDRTLNKCLSL